MEKTTKESDALTGVEFFMGVFFIAGVGLSIWIGYRLIFPWFDNFLPRYEKWVDCYLDPDQYMCPGYKPKETCELVPYSPGDSQLLIIPDVDRRDL